MNEFDIRVPDLNKAIKVRNQEIRDNEERTRNFQQESLKLLTQIEQNTAVLRQIHDILQQSGERQEEMLSVIMDVLSVLSASNKEEAQSMFSKVMDRINKLGAGADTMLKFYTFGNTVLQLVHSIHF